MRHGCDGGRLVLQLSLDAEQLSLYNVEHSYTCEKKKKLSQDSPTILAFYPNSEIAFETVSYQSIV